MVNDVYSSDYYIACDKKIDSSCGGKLIYKKIVVIYYVNTRSTTTHLFAKCTNIPSVNTVRMGPMNAERNILPSCRIRVPTICGKKAVTMLSNPNANAKKHKKHTYITRQ